MPTTSEGFAGFTERIFSVVVIFWPPMINGYSRPSCLRTSAIASRIFAACSGLLKSRTSSLRNGPRAALAECVVGVATLNCLRWNYSLLVKNAAYATLCAANITSLLFRRRCYRVWFRCDSWWPGFRQGSTGLLRICHRAVTEYHLHAWQHRRAYRSAE